MTKDYLVGYEGQGFVVEVSAESERQAVRNFVTKYGQQVPLAPCVVVVKRVGEPAKKFSAAEELLLHVEEVES